MGKFANGRSVVGSGDVQGMINSMAIGAEPCSVKDALNKPIPYYNGNMNYQTYADLATNVQAHGPNQVDIDGITFFNNSGQEMAATTAGVGFIYNDGFCQKGYGANCEGGFCGGLPYKTFVNAHDLYTEVSAGNTLNPSFSNNNRRPFTVANQKGQQRNIYQ